MVEKRNSTINALSCNGSTQEFDSCNTGSNPVRAVETI